MESTASRLPTPFRSMRHRRFSEEKGWRLTDISMSSSGHIGIAGGNNNTDRTSLDLYSDSREKPKLFHSREYDKYSTQSYANVGRLVAFLQIPHKIVTCVLDSLDIIELNEERILKSTKVDGKVECVAASNGKIFTALWRSNQITLFDEDLNIEGTIIMEDMQDGDYPYDLAATSEGLYVCTFSWPAGARAFSKINGNILCEFKNTTRKSSNANSVSVSVSLGLVSVLWDWNQILFYAISDITCLLVFECGSARIRISDRGTFVTGSRSSGEVKMYDMAELFTYRNFKEKLVSLLSKEDCLKLINHFAISRGHSREISESPSPGNSLLLALEEKGIIDTANIDALADAFTLLDIEPSCYQVIEIFQKTRMQPTFYGTFLATLSAHLTSTVPDDLCTYFDISKDVREKIVSSRDPGLSFLLGLDESGFISSSDVGVLEQPFAELGLLQALAKIHEYQSAIKEEDLNFREEASLSAEDKRDLFVRCIRRKIQDWYETMTPVPWKRSCKWRAADLFVGSGLILTRSGSNDTLADIDEKCKLHYTEILTHESLTSEYRIILEGDPGSGKTMLASQLAYDWSQGKFSEIKLLILLPLKFVKNKTILEAIKEFYFPRHPCISCADIEFFLLDNEAQNYLLLDGLEEYNPRQAKGEQSELTKIMSKASYSSCKVIVTSRSDYVQDLPHYPMLRLGRFSKTERDCYLSRVYPDDIKKQVEIKEVIEKSPFLLDLCSVPLLFVLTVHNVESMMNMHESHLSKVAPFMSNMVNTLCPTGGFIDNNLSLNPQIEQYIHGRSFLERCAFNGLCKGQQQLSWPKKFIDINVSKSKQWIDSGIFVVEEGLVEAGNMERQPMGEAMASKGHSGDGESSTADVASEHAGQGFHYDIPSGESETRNSHDALELGAGVKTDSIPTSKERSLQETRISSLLRDPKQHDESCDSTAKHFPLHIRFLHKILQEWFAAKHFSQQIKQLKKEEMNLDEQLSLISPTDLHYVLRFTCALHSPCFHVIVTYLIQYNRSQEGSLPKHILDCVFLCFAEYDGPITREVLEVVTEVCKHGISIDSRDSRLLQHAKVSMIELASKHQVPTKKLFLADLLESASEEELTFNTGIKLGVFDTVEMIEITQWNQQLKDRDYENTVGFLSKCTSLKATSLHFPVQPPDVKKEMRSSLEINKTTITWIIGKRLRHILDIETGFWKIVTEEVPQVETDYNEEDESMDTSLSTVEVISRDGGTIQIPSTNVKLEILPDALPQGMTSCRISLKIVNPSTGDQTSNFGSNCSVVVELLPNNLKLRYPASLTLPHCLQLKKTTGKNVTVFMSHHEKGSAVTWEKTELPYLLQDDSCTIDLRSFCWVKYNIDDQIVEAKKILVYTAKEKISPDDDVTKIDVAYRLNLPGAKEILQMNKNLTVGEERPLLFFKDGRYPLSIRFNRCTPMKWKYCTPEDDPKIISFVNVEASVESSCPFTFEKLTDGISFCTFKISQMSDNIELTMPLKTERNDESLFSSSGMVQPPQEARSRQPSDFGGDLNAAVSSKKNWKETLDEPRDDTGRCLLTIDQHKEPSEYVTYEKGKLLTENPLLCYSKVQHQFPPLTSKHHSYEHASKFPPTDQFGEIFQHQAHAQHSHSPLENQFRFKILNEIAKDLDPHDPLGNDWRRLADELGFSMRDINAFKNSQGPTPTVSVIDTAVKYGKLKSVEELKEILTKMERIDAASHISGDDIQRSTKSVVSTQAHLETASISESLSQDLCIRQPQVKTNSECPTSSKATKEEGRVTDDAQLDSRAIDHMQQRDQIRRPLQISVGKRRDELMHITFQFLSSKIGSTWKNIGRHLGIADGELDCIQIDNNSLQETIYQMFLFWKKQKGSNAKYTKLIKALKHAGRKDLAEAVQNREDLQRI